MSNRFYSPKRNIIIDTRTGDRYHIKGEAFKQLADSVPRRVNSEAEFDNKEYIDLTGAVEQAINPPTTRMAGDKLTQQSTQPNMTQVPIMKAASQPVTRQDNRAYINEDVTRSEARAIDLIKAELNPHLINQRDYGIDLQTDIGPIDVQYTSSGRPILDLISWGHLKGYQGKLAPFSEAQAIHRTINNDINQGANLQDVMQRLNSLGVTIGKPGKILNTDAYPSVAFLTKQGNVFSNPMAIDMAAVRQTLTDNPMRDLGAKVYFNNKLKYPRSRNDTFESAMVMLNDPAILKDFNITNRFF